MLPLCVTYHPSLSKINKILKQNLNLLVDSPQTNHFAQKNLVATFRRGRNLKDILVKNDIRREPKKTIGIFKCGKKCKLCKHIMETSTVYNWDKSYCLKIKSHLNCNSVSVVYLIQCKKCNTQYIGQTSNSLKERMYSHFNDIANKNEFKPVSEHFSKRNHTINDVQVMPLIITSQCNNTRLRYEDALIYNFKCRKPWGLNLIS